VTAVRGRARDWRREPTVTAVHRPPAPFDQTRISSLVPPPVLCVRAGGLGDLLLLRPAVASLAADGHGVWLLAPERYASALLGPGGVERVIDWEGPQVAALLASGSSPQGPLAESLRMCAGAVVYSSDPLLVRTITQLVSRTISHPPMPAHDQHAAIWYRRPALAFAKQPVDPEIFRATAEERQQTADLLRRLGLPSGFLAIHPGSGSSAKNWPLSQFVALVEAVSPQAAWLLVEGPAEQGRLAELRRLPGARALSGMPPRALGVVLSAAGVYVGNDSGVTHLAAAWGVPTVALFGPTNPAIWAPTGPHVAIVAAPGGDLSSLAIESALAAIRRLREGPRPATPGAM
jgi:heptosyltransferase-3